MLPKIIVSVIFIGLVTAFFVFLSDIDTTIKDAGKANVVEEDVVKVKKKAKRKAKQVVAGDQDPLKAGYSLFKRRCLGCHTSDKGAPNRTGPNLWGIVNRPKGQSEGYRYSQQLRMLGGVWTEAEIITFMASPRSLIKDTKMTFNGIKVEKDRNNILLFLKTLKD